MEVPERSPCPYCKALYVSGATSCASCQVQFPWVSEIAELRGQIKERETSRIRATSTLLNEVHSFYRGKGAISIEAVKGFVHAWLFQRPLIVVGSLLGAGLLAFQTYILYSQTELLAKQSEAAQVDRAIKIRERLSVTGEYDRRLQQLSNSVNLLSLVPDRCNTDECADTPILSLVDSFAAGNPRGDAEALVVFARIVRNLKIHRNTTEWSAPATAGPNYTVRELIDPASIQCAMDPRKARAAEDSASVLSAMISITGSLEPDDKNQNSGESQDNFVGFMRALSSMHQLVTHGKESLIADRDHVTILRNVGADKPEQRLYTLQTFVEDLSQLIARAGADVEALGRRCTEIIEVDMQALRDIYPERRNEPDES